MMYVDAGQINAWDLLNLPIGTFLMTPRPLSAQTAMITSKTAFEVRSWRDFDRDAQHYLQSVRGQLEEITLWFKEYNFDCTEASNEISLYGKLEFSLFAVVTNIASGLNLGMEITDSSGTFQSWS